MLLKTRTTSRKKITKRFAPALLSCSLALMGAFSTFQVQAALIQSPNDHRQYDTFTLPNQMQVVVISDPNTDKAAASMNVEVGSMDNPKGREGLAHFLEHMLFLGTGKYPKADAYQHFIDANGGDHNAYTADENTNYFFDIKASELPEALDRFSQFFIDPLFTPQYVDRERHAVYSEFQAKRRDDGRRLYVAGKLALNPDNNMSRFAVGDLQTLADRPNDPVREDLVNFYKTHYSANLMNLVVVGKESTSELRKMVEKYFAAVPNHAFEPTQDSAPIYAPNKLPQQLNVQTLSDTRLVKLTFPIPATRDLWQTKPVYYIANILGYEGKGSLLSRLKELGWARGLVAHTSVDTPENASLSIDIDLTDEGYAHYNDVVEKVFAYIKLLRENGVQAMLYQQQSQLAATDFRFQESGSPLNTASSLSVLMTRYPSAHLLDGSYVMNNFSPEIINRFLDKLTPNELTLTLASDQVKTDQQSPRYKINYALHPIEQKRIARWLNPKADAALTIPTKNPYIAEDLSLIDAPADNKSIPEEIWQNEDSHLWYLGDSSFSAPRANLFFALLSPIANSSARNAVLSDLYAQVTEDRLNEVLYDASLAGMSTQIYSHMRGVSVRISGYNDRMETLLNDVLDKLASQPISEERFARIKAMVQDQLANEAKDKPYQQTFKSLYDYLLPGWSAQEKLAVIDSLTLKDLQEFIPALIKPGHLRILAHGNLSQEKADKLGHDIAEKLLPATNQTVATELPVNQLPEGKGLTSILDIDHNDSVLTRYMQGQDTEYETRARVAMLNEIISSRFYNDIRTEQQLGYIVFSSYMPLRDVPGLILVTESPETAPDKLQQAYDTFLDGFEKSLASLSSAELKQYKASLISRINRRDNTLGDRTARFWQALDNGNPKCNTRQQISDAVKKLSRKDLVETLTYLRSHALDVMNYGEKYKAAAPKQDDLKQLKSLTQHVPGSDFTD